MSALKNVMARAAAASAAALIILTIAACGKKSEPAGGGPPGGGMPPAEVGVIAVKPETVGLATELPGRLEASRTAQVRARAAGIVEKRLFKEGSDVKPGQALFRIDSAPYQASAASAQATLARAQASANQAKSLAERYKPLVEANAISQQEYANAVAAQKTAEADVAVARATVRSAGITLGYASITAPIGGRIGRALVTEGALVGQGDATPLAVIQQIDPMYVNFTQSTTDVMRLRRDIESGKFSRAGADGASVRLLFEDGSEYAHRGKLLFTELTVDATSGQVTLRAEVPNPKALLLPGMYVRVRLEQAKTESGILLPQQAVTRGTNGDTVMVVAPDGKVAPRPVTIGSAQDGQWVVLDGLKPGEQVMVDGFQKLRGNAPVKAVPWQGGAAASAPFAMAAASAAPAASSPAAPASSASAR